MRDQDEQEAGRISEMVMRMPEPGPRLARPCGAAYPGPRAHKPGNGHERLQIKPAASAGIDFTEAPLRVHEVLSSPGRLLDANTREFMEPRFGHDFSRVRVHTDTEAARSAEQLHASAYTFGNHVVFAEAGFVPSTPEGSRLLAHELTHVVQGAGQKSVLRRKPDPKGPHTQPAEARLRVRIVDTLEATKKRAVDLVDSAIRRGDRAYLEGLGLTSKQVDLLLDNSTTPAFKMTFGTAAELELERAVRADPLLSQYVHRGPLGRVPRGVGKPDWIIETPSSSIPVDLMTTEQVEKKLEMWRRQWVRGKPKWYVEKGLNITYDRPAGPATSGPLGNRPTADVPPTATRVAGEPGHELGTAGGDVMTASRTGGIAARLGSVAEAAAPFVDAALMSLSYGSVGVDATAFKRLSVQKLQPIVDKELKTRSAEIAEVAGTADGFWGVYANVRCELHYRFLPDEQGQSLGKMQLYDVRFLSMSITGHDVNKAHWNKELGRRVGEGVQDATLSVLIYVPQHPELSSLLHQPKTTNPLYFSRSYRTSSLPPQPVTTDELLRWARIHHPRLFDDPTLSKNILYSDEFTGSMQAREEALNDLRLRIQEDKNPF